MKRIVQFVCTNTHCRLIFEVVDDEGQMDCSACPRCGIMTRHMANVVPIPAIMRKGIG